MNDEQKALLKQIKREKRKLRPDKKLLISLVKRLVSYDDYEWDVKYGRRNDPGGRSRSPSFGRWTDNADTR